MKSILLILLLSFKTYAQITFQIIGPCDSTPLIREKIPFSQKVSTVGDSTIFFLKKYNIAYNGAKEGIRSIEGIPTSEQELIIISNEEMLAYGWCYSVNGRSPEVYPHKFDLSEGDEVEWYFAFSRYLKGKWISQCKPSYLEPRKEFCPQ